MPCCPSSDFLNLESVPNLFHAAIIPIMRLQKMGTYRLLRLMRVVLPIVVLVLIAIPARNYLTSRDRVAASPSSPARGARPARRARVVILWSGL